MPHTIIPKYRLRKRSQDSGKKRVPAAVPIPDVSVDYINKTVFDYAVKEGQANAYQAVVQSMSQAVQNATLSVQHTEAIVAAAEAVMTKKMTQYLMEQDYTNATLVFEFMQQVLGPTGPLFAKNAFLAAVGETTTEIVKEFPNGTS
jgi:hypothetical protein